MRLPRRLYFNATLPTANSRRPTFVSSPWNSIDVSNPPMLGTIFYGGNVAVRRSTQVTRALSSPAGEGDWRESSLPRRRAAREECGHPVGGEGTLSLRWWDHPPTVRLTLEDRPPATRLRASHFGEARRYSYIHTNA